MVGEYEKGEGLAWIYSANRKRSFLWLFQTEESVGKRERQRFYSERKYEVRGRKREFTH